MNYIYPQKKDSRIISEQSERILYSQFSSDSFNISKIHGENDYGLDYRIEIIKKNQVLGYEFYIQLKGFKELKRKDKIHIPISVSTLNYWKNKIIPVLIIAIDCKSQKAYFEWFDKLIKIKHHQNTQTIIINLANELVPNKIKTYVEAYYLGFIESIKDVEIYSFYKHLFYNSILMSTAIDNKFIAFLYPPKLTDAELEKHNKFYLDAYIKIFAKFIYDLKVYHIQLPEDPIHEIIKAHIRNFNNIHKQICISESTSKFSKGKIYNVTINSEKAIYYLPILSRMFAELNLFFVKYFLRYNELEYEQVYICEKIDH